MADENPNPDPVEAIQYVEEDPTGCFRRSNVLISSDALKKVYKAIYDVLDTEVAWHIISLEGFTDKEPALVDWVYSEIELWKKLDNKNIIACYKVWKAENDTIHFISELCTSGTSRDFRKKYRRLPNTTYKRWAKQILEGLNYLHNHDPCIIHSDLTCANIYVNGSTGEIKIGDPSYAALIGKGNPERNIGTPEYMAPELFEEDYTETVDIYSFGMCLLEIITAEIPYSECANVDEIREKTRDGIKPEALSKVNDPEFKELIEKCIADPLDRPSASELLDDEFFDQIA